MEGKSSEDNPESDETVAEVTEEEAIEFYKKEFARHGCYPTPNALKNFFNECLKLDGYVDSERVGEIVAYCKSKKADKFWINIKDVENFFETK